MEQGERPMVSSQIFRTEKNQKGNQSICFEVCQPEAVKPLLHQIIHYQEEAEFVRKHADRLPSLFGGFGKSEDWSTIEQIINDMGVLHSLLLNYSKNIAKATQIKQNLSVQLTEGLRSFRDMHAHSLNELYQLAERLVNIENRLSSTLGISAETLYMNSADWINTALAKCPPPQRKSGQAQRLVPVAPSIPPTG